MHPYKVSFSIVLYRQSVEEIKAVLDSLQLYCGEKRIFLMDNSPTDSLSVLSCHEGDVYYEWMKTNVGFGKAHNVAFSRAREYGSRYHFIVNPDISYTSDVADSMLAYMDRHEDVGQMMPKIVYRDGTIQYLPKLQPTPWLLFWRKMKRPRFMHERQMQRFEMRAMHDDRVYDIACVSGCFTVVRMSALDVVGEFDDRFFLYFEDTDFSRRMHAHFRTLYYPSVSVAHGYGRGAGKNLRLLKCFVTSCCQYFFKWGWFFDKQRRRANKAVLGQLDCNE